MYVCFEPENHADTEMIHLGKLTENYGVYTYGMYTQMDNTVTNLLVSSYAEH